MLVFGSILLLSVKKIKSETLFSGNAQLSKRTFLVLPLTKSLSEGKQSILALLNMLIYSS